MNGLLLTHFRHCFGRHFGESVRAMNNKAVFLFLAFSVLVGFSIESFADQQVIAEKLKSEAVKLDGIVNSLQQAASTGFSASAVAAASSASEAKTLVEEASKLAAATPSDNNDWTGDHLQIKGNIAGLKKYSIDGDKDYKKYFAPAYVRFDVTKENGDGTVVVVPRNNFTICEPTKSGAANDDSSTTKTSPSCKIKVSPWQEHNFYGWLFSRGSPLHSISFSGTPVQVDLPESSTYKLVQPYDTYIVNKQDIEKVPYVKYGWIYGALLVPFKYMRDAEAMVNSTSYQLYLGYRRDANGDGEGPFLSAGVSSADIPTGAGTATSKQGISYGWGWLFEIKKGSGIQLMVMAGQDRFGANSGYNYEGGVWYSLSLGFKLGDNKAK